MNNYYRNEKTRRIKYARTQGKSKEDAVSYVGELSNEINLLGMSAAQRDQAAAAKMGDWILDAYWEFGMVD